MYDLDQFIKRLIELREIAKAGGKTPVAACDSGGHLMPLVAVGLSPATPRMRGEELVGWDSNLDANTTQVVRVF
jgi:hypothetical protein